RSRISRSASERMRWISSLDSRAISRLFASASLIAVSMMRLASASADLIFASPTNLRRAYPAATATIAVMMTATAVVMESHPPSPVSSRHGQLAYDGAVPGGATCKESRVAWTRLLTFAPVVQIRLPARLAAFKAPERAVSCPTGKAHPPHVHAKNYDSFYLSPRSVVKESRPSQGVESLYGKSRPITLEIARGANPRRSNRP